MYINKSKHNIKIDPSTHWKKNAPFTPHLTYSNDMLDPGTCYMMSPLIKRAAPGLLIQLNYIILSAIVIAFIIFSAF